MKLETPDPKPVFSPPAARRWKNSGRAFAILAVLAALPAFGFVVDLNESAAIDWPSVSTLKAAPLRPGGATSIHVALDSYCFFNHPSLRTGTVLHGTAKLVRGEGGRPVVSIRASRATMRDGREITFAERQWTVELPASAARPYVLPKGTRLSEGRLVASR